MKTEEHLSYNQYEVEHLDTQFVALQGWFNRWFQAVNHKDIAGLYFILAALSGVIGTTMSIFIRMELAFPGSQIFFI